VHLLKCVVGSAALNWLTAEYFLIFAFLYTNCRVIVHKTTNEFQILTSSCGLWNNFGGYNCVNLLTVDRLMTSFPICDTMGNTSNEVISPVRFCSDQPDCITIIIIIIIIIIQFVYAPYVAFLWQTIRRSGRSSLVVTHPSTGLLLGVCCVVCAV
jgi:hypothetical protein